MPAYNVTAISHPEFINIDTLSPFAAKCQIKVLYIGQNRNKSLITKEVATNMAKTLPGCPIVGYFKEEIDDFRDHGKVVKIEEGKINIEKKTKPYGFIAPDAKIWFQNFEESDEYGNTVIREYLLVEGYLWTQFDGADLALEDGGRPQSMELDEESLDGYWSKDFSSNIEFFIINDAKFKALCILGEDVEPCFEGSNITKPDIYSFNGEDIISGLSDIMKQLQFTLNKLEGGNQKMVKDLENQGKLDEQIAIENQNNIENFAKKEEDKKEEKDSTSDKENSNDSDSGKEEEDKKKEKVANNACGDDDDKKKVTDHSLTSYDGEESTSDSDASSDTDTDSADASDSADVESATESEVQEANASSNSADVQNEDDDVSSKLKSDFAKLSNDFSELQIKYSELEESYNELVKFKKSIEDSKKDDMIKSFYMLDDEDKKDVIAHKSEYTLDEIESKLSVICVRKKVNFDLDADTDKKDEVPTTYDLNGINTESSSIPAWLKAVEATQNRNK